MKRKLFISTLIIMVMVCALAVPAFAASSGGGSGSGSAALSSAKTQANVGTVITNTKTSDIRRLNILSFTVNPPFILF